MKEMKIFHYLAGWMKMFGKKEKSGQSLENYLYNHRLRRNFEDESPPGEVSLWNTHLAGKFFAVIFVIALGLAPLRAVLAAPFLTLSSFSGNPGVTLQVSGGGFQSGEKVNVYVGTNTVAAASATAQDNSLFGPVAVAIPANAPQGPLSIRATGGTSGIAESNSYYVVPFNPAITVTAPSNTPGSSAIVEGTGFAPGETVNFILNGITGGHVTADSSGNFTAAIFTIPSVPSATYQLHATGASSGADAINYFYVGGFYPSAYPSVYYLLPGDAITFSGSSFGANETVQVYAGSASSSVSSLTADGAGSFANAGSYTIPLGTHGGIKTFTLKGATTGVQAPAIMVTVGDFNSLVTPSAYWVMPGGSVSFSGSGFARGEEVKVFAGNSQTASATFLADSSGAFQDAGSVTIPVSDAGKTIVFTVKGSTSGTMSTAEITVGSLFPAITPSDWWLVPGQEFSISGSGFAGGENVQVTAGTETATVTADASGAFDSAGPFRAPFSPGGIVTVNAKGQLSNLSAPELAISKGSLNPMVSPDAWWVMPGTNLAFSGSGFIPGESINVDLGAANVATFTASNSGSFASSTITIPYGSERSETYTFTGQTSGGIAQVSIQVAGLHPYAEADTYYATPGSTVNVRAHGFGAGESVTVSINSLDKTVTADSSGDTPLVPITIPVSTTGTATITFTGSLSGATASVPVTLAPFSAQVMPSVWWTYPGARISFNGSGFAGGETVSITSGTTAIGSTTASSTGAFVTQDFTIPFSAHGNVDYTFTGQTSGATASVSIGLGSLSPSIWLSTYWDTAGAPLKVNGGGFAPGETVTVSFEGVTLGSPVADSSGSIELTTTVPYGPAGSKTIQANGGSSGVAAPPVTFTQPQVYVNVQLGSYAGAPGDAVTFIGSGYLPNEPVEVTTSRTGSTVAHSFTADASGSFNDSGYTAPSPGGPLTLTITGKHSFTSKSIVYYVTGP